MNNKLLPLILILFTFICIICNSNTQNDIIFKEVQYTVSSGETLWSIAQQYCPEGMDIREYIYKLNISPEIYAGQTITILEEVK